MEGGKIMEFINSAMEFIKPAFVFIKDMVNMLPFEPYINYIIVSFIIGYFVGKAMLYMHPWKISVIVGVLVYLILTFI